MNAPLILVATAMNELNNADHRLHSRFSNPAQFVGAVGEGAPDCARTDTEGEDETRASGQQAPGGGSREKH